MHLPEIYIVPRLLRGCIIIIYNIFTVHPGMLANLEPVNDASKPCARWRLHLLCYDAHSTLIFISSDLWININVIVQQRS